MIPIDRSKKFTKYFDKVDEGRVIDFIILHHIEAKSVDHAIDQLTQHGVSAHFLIAENGGIFELVEANNIAYHAGVSFWKGCEGLNKNSIGIEFINSNACGKKFEEVQMQSALKLCLYLMQKYQIVKEAVIGHSDIAYDQLSGLHNRKQDPSHLFDWEFLAQNNVGVFPKVTADHSKIFTIGDETFEILNIKKILQKVGYRIVNLDNKFDLEMQSVVRVFNRKFLGEELGCWTSKSDAILKSL